MIASVELRITTDDGIPVVLFGQTELTVQRDGDFEKNLLVVGDAAEAMLANAGVDLKRKLLQLRGVDPTLAHPDDATKRRPGRRDRRG